MGIYLHPGCGTRSRSKKNWQPDPHANMVDAFHINWTHQKAYAFTPFALIGRVLAKAMRGKRT